MKNIYCKSFRHVFDNLIMAFGMDRSMFPIQIGKELWCTRWLSSWIKPMHSCPNQEKYHEISNFQPVFTTEEWHLQKSKQAPFFFWNETEIRILFPIIFWKCWGLVWKGNKDIVSTLAINCFCFCGKVSAWVKVLKPCCKRASRSMPRRHPVGHWSICTCAAWALPAQQHSCKSESPLVWEITECLIPFVYATCLHRTVCP